MTQKRQTLTKTYIKEALTLLLNEERFEDISVSKISKKSGINRGTFYLRYLDKFDLMDQLKEETIGGLKVILIDGDKEPQQIIREALEYIQSDFAFLYAVSQSSYANFSETMKEFVLVLVDWAPNGKKRVTQMYDIPQDYALGILAASIESIISQWLQGGATEDIEEVTTMILCVSKFDEWM